MGKPTAIYAQAFEVIGTGSTMHFNFLQRTPRMAKNGTAKFDQPELAACVVMATDAAMEMYGVLRDLFEVDKQEDAEKHVQNTEIIKGKMRGTSCDKQGGMYGGGS